jgi:hypothetical protein
MPQEFNKRARPTKGPARTCITTSTVLLALLSFSTAAKAACGGTQPYVLCSDVQVTLLYIEAGGNAYIKVDGNPESMDCALNGGYITLPGSSARFNAVYATLLAAQSMGRKVSIRMGPQAQCTAVYVTLAGQ